MLNFVDIEPFTLATMLAAAGPFGAVGTDLGLHGIKLVIGLVVNFFLGSFMMIAYAFDLTTLSYIVVGAMFYTAFKMF